MPSFGRQTIALLDHLGVDQAVVGGTSLGANASLEAAVQSPGRLRGLVIEMPVLDSALVACALAFTPLLVGLSLGAPVARLAGRALQLVPRGISQLGDVVLDTMRQDPAPSAAVLQGLFFGRIAPPREERREIATDALVIGHPRDPVHPFGDSGMLVSELPNGRLLAARSFFELRLAPERLTGEIAGFLQECWRPVPVKPAGRARPARHAAKPKRARSRAGSSPTPARRSRAGQAAASPRPRAQ